MAAAHPTEEGVRYGTQTPLDRNCTFVGVSPAAIQNGPKAIPPSEVLRVMTLIEPPAPHPLDDYLHLRSIFLRKSIAALY